MGGGEPFAVVAPHRHAHVLGETAPGHAPPTSSAAIGAALAAAPAWRELPFDERAAVFLRAADLLSTTWRDRLNAATMLGQSKTVQQAEIDSACELADFLRFNVHFARADPRAAAGELAGVVEPHRTTGRSRASSWRSRRSTSPRSPATCRSAPALLGNVVVWKPSPTQQLAAHHTMRLFEAAGLPPGVINMVTGDGAAVSEVALPHPALAGIHFTGSTADLPAPVARGRRARSTAYATYPRLVGETGGKDFVVAHPVGRPGRAGHRPGARRVRVPGPEVLGRLARLRPALAVGRRRARRARRRRPSR